MEFSKDRKEALLSAKATGHLIPELQTMTDEEFLSFIQKRTEVKQRDIKQNTHKTGPVRL